MWRGTGAAAPESVLSLLVLQLYSSPSVSCGRHCDTVSTGLGVINAIAVIHEAVASKLLLDQFFTSTVTICNSDGDVMTAPSYHKVARLVQLNIESARICGSSWTEVQSVIIIIFCLQELTFLTNLLLFPRVLPRKFLMKACIVA